MIKKFFLYILGLLVLLGIFFALQYRSAVSGDGRFDSGEQMNISCPSDLPVSRPGGFHTEYAVVPSGKDVQADSLKDACYGLIMVDLTDNRVVSSYHAYNRIYPASTTKIMTALIVLDALDRGEIRMEDMVTYVDLPDMDPDAVKSDLTPGCQISVRNLLYGLLIRSYNDYALELTTLFGGEAQFVSLMNQKAAELGMVGTHYVNPHGLHEDEHYTTAYDMYLLMRAARDYPVLEEIDRNASFSYTYLDREGESRTDQISPTNLYLAGYASLPSNIEMNIWKTGTTRQAGHVLTMDCTIDGRPYMIYCADHISTENLYADYSLLFNLK